MQIGSYLNNIAAVYATGVTTEHSYRPALQSLFASIDPNLDVINEPGRIACGAPDFVIQRKKIPVGHVEAKDLPIDIAKLSGPNKEQQQRYLKALPNLIYTNGVDFAFYRNGEAIGRVTIAALSGGKLVPQPDQFEALVARLKDFAAQTPVTITSAQKLAQMMAGKAALIKEIMGNALDQSAGGELHEQYKAFQQFLIADITPADFADVYAETIAYGLFAARLHDETPDTFTRQEALDLLPKTNPFLRNLFSYVAGPNLDDRIAWVVDELCDIFRACDLHALLRDFGKFTAQTDPFIHFYETFLAAYNPAKRKARGVWYTPEPVVNFIVRAVDDVLKSEFGLADGIADTSKISIDWDSGQKDKKGKPVLVKKDIHRVQILDPAAGTGTFLAEVVRQVAERVKPAGGAAWNAYVEEHLIPRLHGFELLMASYAMCHMKLDLMLSQLGYKPSANPPRLSVYLTNSLEEGDAADQTLPFAKWLSDEARGANAIKRDVPIMCIIGNPPYSGHSSNKGKWITGLMDAYKREPGGLVRLQERNPKWLNDDYVKFIRMAEHMIDKNGEGVLAFITNHGYLDNPTFRGMRWHLMSSFDAIHVIDLHGNSKKKEVCPDGSPDKNVFDIQQGVALIVAVRRKDHKVGAMAKVNHGELWGKRASKYTALSAQKFANVTNPIAKMTRALDFVQKNVELEGVYRNGFDIRSLMPLGVMGFQTHRDDFAISTGRDDLDLKRKDLNDKKISDEIIKQKYDLRDNRDWNLKDARLKLSDKERIKAPIVKCLYRLFDKRYCILDETFMDYPRKEFIDHVRGRENIVLGIGRQGLAVGGSDWSLVHISKYAIDANVFRRGGIHCMPLYE